MEQDFVVCFLLGNSLASEFYIPTFRNTQFYLHRKVGVVIQHLPAYEDETKCYETSAYKIQTPGKIPRRKHRTYRTRRKFEIRNRFCALRGTLVLGSHNCDLLIN